MDSLRLDFKYALRSIAGSKRLAATVVITLALGIGANTAVFGVLHALVLTPLPYAEPDRLVRLYQSMGGADGYFPGPAVIELRARSKTLDVAMVYTYSADGVDLTDRPTPERVRRLPVSADYFRVLRARLVLGEAFRRDDERRDPGVAVISERVWRTHLGASPSAVGRVLALSGVPHRIVGVTPAGFEDPLEPGVDVWTPIDLQTPSRNSWGNFYLSAIARLQPGVTIGEARAEAKALAAPMNWDVAPTAARPTIHAAPLQEDTVGSTGPLLWILLGAVGLLLVIACVNVASLLLARGAARESELAVRAALGCSGARLVRQLLVESLLLALAGCGAGLLLSRAVTTALLAAAPAGVARAGGALQTPVILFSLAIAAIASVGFGLAPALQAMRPDLETTLRETARGSGGRRGTRARNILVVAQVALALVLLVGAGLLLRSFDRLRAVDLGVQSTNILTFQVNLPVGRYAAAEKRMQFHRDFEARLSTLSGVRVAAAVSRLPVTGAYHSWGTWRADRPPDTPRAQQTQQRVVEGEYFRALGIPLLRGRTFGPEDNAQAPRRVVVSQELVRQAFGTEDPVGKPLRIAGAQVEIIGVVGDVAIGARLPQRPYVYHSHSQFGGDRNWALTQLVALDGDRPGIAADIRRELAAIDPALVLYEPRMLDDVIGGGVAQERFALLLVAGFAALAVTLAAIGIYGVLSYSVSRRSREMGIRMALGAPAATVRSLIVADGGRLAAFGIVLGFVAALAATRVLSAYLFNVSATEPAVFVSAGVALFAVALAASWIPARAATKADPMQAVRDAQ